MTATLQGSPAEVLAQVEDLFTGDLAERIARLAERSAPTTAPGSGDPTIAPRSALWESLSSLGIAQLDPSPSLTGGEPDRSASTRLAELAGRAAYGGPLLDTLTATELAQVALPDLAEPVAEGASLAVCAPGAGLVADWVRAVDEVRHVVFVRPVAASGVAAPGVTVDVVAATDVRVTTRHDTARTRTFRVEADPGSIHAAYADPGGESWSRALAGARLRQASFLAGLAHTALDVTVHRVRTREQFGSPIGQRQAVAFALAEAATELAAVDHLVAHAARPIPAERASALAAQVLATAGESAVRVVALAVQLHGAYGTTEASIVQLLYRRVAVERGLWGSSRALLRDGTGVFRTQRAAAVIGRPY